MEKCEDFQKPRSLPSPIAIPSSPFFPHSPTYSHPPPSPSPPPPPPPPQPQFCPGTPPHDGGPPPSPPAVVMSPCAACKILRRRCADKCVLAPYFPPTEPYKFTIAHRVFGAANIIKFLQDLPESRRADAVSSMVYEASARIRDPVYGCTGAISQLQKQVVELQAQLAKAQAEVANLQCQNTNLFALICMEMSQSQDQPVFQQQCPAAMDASCFQDETNLVPSWELWT